MKKIISILVVLAVLVLGYVFIINKKPVDTTSNTPQDNAPVVYTNSQYGFNFTLPKTWNNYHVVVEQWTGRNPDDSSSTEVKGPELRIRDNASLTKYQEIPIMVFTLPEWDLVSKEKLVVSAAPFGPAKLGSNSKYVFALPPRFQYAEPSASAEVEYIVHGSDSFHAF